MRALIQLVMLFAWGTLQAQEAAALQSRAKKVVATLCAPEMHGRGYVENGDGLAADWIAEQYKAMGLPPIKADYFEPFTFNVNSFPDSIKVELDGNSLVPGVDFLVDPSSGSASGTFELVHLTADAMMQPERKATVMGSLPGKAACLHFPATTNADTLQAYRALERELMHYCPVVRVASGKLTWGAAQEAMPYPLVEVASDQLTEASRTIRIDVRNSLLVKHQARNVLGTIKGKGRKWIIIGAHYDHLGQMGPDVLFPGANDNASGVAMLLSLADHFSKFKPQHNLLFAAFAGEEAGLVGSDWCAVDRPINLPDVKMMLNLDILGTGDDGIMVVNATEQQAAYDLLVKINGKRRYLPQVKSRGPACNSDHCPFVKRGVPGIFVYTLGGIAAYHDVLDKAETLPLNEFADLHFLLRDFIDQLK